MHFRGIIINVTIHLVNDPGRPQITSARKTASDLQLVTCEIQKSESESLETETLNPKLGLAILNGP